MAGPNITITKWIVFTSDPKRQKTTHTDENDPHIIKTNKIQQLSQVDFKVFQTGWSYNNLT